MVFHSLWRWCETALIYRTQQLTEIWANSGHSRDIQNAVDQAKTGDVVRIPEGTFNFVEVGEPWMTVNIPIGVNLFGEGLKDMLLAKGTRRKEVVPL